LRVWFLVGVLIGLQAGEVLTAFIGLALALLLCDAVVQQFIIRMPALEYLSHYLMGLRYLELGFGLAGSLMQLLKRLPNVGERSRWSRGWPVLIILTLFCFKFVPFPSNNWLGVSPVTGSFIRPPPSFPGKFLIGDVDVRHNLYYDNFSAEKSFNAGFWNTGTPLLQGIARGFASTLVGLGVAHTSSGFVMSGVTGANEFVGIQSIASFSTPLTLETAVDGTEANGNAFVIYLVTKDLDEYLTMSANLNVGNGSYYGIWLGSTARGVSLGSDAPQMLYQQPGKSIWYIARMAVDSRGLASVTLFNEDRMILASKRNVEVGRGPFYIILGQREGMPITAGPNEAVWSWLMVTSDQIFPD
jgi:hypothetical protein